MYTWLTRHPARHSPSRPNRPNRGAATTGPREDPEIPAARRRHPREGVPRRLRRPRALPAHVQAALPQPRVLYDMERPSALSNIWLIVQTVGWIMALEGVAEYFSERHYESLFRHLLVLALGCDPAKPRLPDNWEEWYYG